MSKNLDKYIYGQMDKKAGLEHTFHRTKIVQLLVLPATPMINYCPW